MGEFKVALSTQDRKRLTKSLPSEGRGFQILRSKNLTKLSGKGRDGPWKWEFSLDAQSEIDQCLTNANSIGGISPPEVLNALEAEPLGLKIRNTFNLIKGSIRSSILEF